MNRLTGFVRIDSFYNWNTGLISDSFHIGRRLPLDYEGAKSYAEKRYNIVKWDTITLLSISDFKCLLNQLTWRSYE